MRLTVSTKKRVPSKQVAHDCSCGCLLHMDSQKILNKLFDESNFNSILSFEQFFKELRHDVNLEVAHELHQIMVKQRTAAVSNVKSRASACLRSLEQANSQDSAIDFSVHKLIQDISTAAGLGDIHLDLIKQKTKHDLRQVNELLNGVSRYISELSMHNADIATSVQSGKCTHLLENI